MFTIQGCGGGGGLTNRLQKYIKINRGTRIKYINKWLPLLKLALAPHSPLQSYTSGSLHPDPDRGILLNPYPDPDPGNHAETGSRPRFYWQTFYKFTWEFFFSNPVMTVFFNPCKGSSNSRRSLQPNKKLFKHKIFSFFPFYRVTFLASVDPDPILTRTENTRLSLLINIGKPFVLSHTETKVSEIGGVSYR